MVVTVTDSCTLLLPALPIGSLPAALDELAAGVGAGQLP
jgi:hypothetical protein